MDLLFAAATPSEGATKMHDRRKTCRNFARLLKADTAGYMFCFCFLFLTITDRPCILKSTGADLRQIFRVGKNMAADDRPDISFSVHERRCHGNQFSSNFRHASGIVGRAKVGLFPASSSTMNKYIGPWTKELKWTLAASGRC